MNIRLVEMTVQLARQFYQDFEMDPDLFADMSKFRPYEFSSEACDAVVARHKRLGRIQLAILADEMPVGEIVLKDLDHSNRCCTLSIHMQNDSVKNKGYGTQAERLVLAYAFETLGMNAVNADALIHNTRSQHVMEKVGFHYVRQDELFKYYRCERS